MPSVRSAVRRLRSIAAQVVDPRVTRPSFTYKDAEMRRVRAAGKALGWTHPVWTVNDKDDAHAWAQRLGVRRPALLEQRARAVDLPWDTLPDRFVLKPVAGADSRGVHLLQRAPGGWHDLGDGRTLTAAQITADLTALAAAGRTSAEVLVEELVSDPRRPGAPPVDWKVLTFFGQVGMVVGKARSFAHDGTPITTWRFFDEHFTDLGPAFSGHRLDTGIAPPVHAAELADMARRISGAVPRSFLRVDLYDGSDGPVFGEITPQPGWRMRIRRDVDVCLGTLWEEAEARLLLRADGAGGLAPASVPLAESAVVLGAPPSSLPAGPMAAAARGVAA